MSAFYFGRTYDATARPHFTHRHAFATAFQKLELPRLIGLFLNGILFGPYVLGWLDAKILLISEELRQIALLIRCIGAWLSLEKHRSTQKAKRSIICQDKETTQKQSSTNPQANAGFQLKKKPELLDGEPQCRNRRERATSLFCVGGNQSTYSVHGIC